MNCEKHERTTVATVAKQQLLTISKSNKCGKRKACERAAIKWKHNKKESEKHTKHARWRRECAV